MMILAENEGRDLQLIELPDGSVSLDTCFKCYTRIGFTHSQLLN
jgi:(p)ppGpp synthase/HD superfamily hydrolase